MSSCIDPPQGVRAWHAVCKSSKSMLADNFADRGRARSPGLEGMSEVPAPQSQGLTPSVPVRVAHVVFNLNGGGLETLVGAMATRFAGSPVSVSVITLKGQPGRVGNSIRHLVEQFHVLKPMRGVSMVAPVRLVRALRQVRPDVVHIHSGCWHKGAVAARLAGVRKVIYTEHGRVFDDSALTCWWQRRLARLTDHVVTVSHRLERQMAAHVGIRPSLVRTIENGIDVTAMSPGPKSSQLLRQLDLPHDTLIVGSVGRLEPIKAYDRLIRAFARITVCEGVHAPLALVLCGNGSQRLPLQRLAEELNVADRTRFPGWVDNPVEYYRLFDVFAMTSRSEGLSVSLLEALACGIPPLVTNVGSNADVLGPTLVDQVVPEWQPEAYRERLLETVISSKRRTQLAAEARRRAVERYSLDRMIAAYTQLYVA